MHILITIKHSQNDRALIVLVCRGNITSNSHLRKWRSATWARWNVHLLKTTPNYPIGRLLCLPPLLWGDILFFSSPSVRLSVRQSVTQFVSATPLKLLNRISWNLVGSKDTIYSCSYYQEIVIAWILWELCPFELKYFPKYTSEAACQRNSSDTTEQNFMKLGR